MTKQTKLTTLIGICLCFCMAQFAFAQSDELYNRDSTYTFSETSGNVSLLRLKKGIS